MAKRKTAASRAGGAGRGRGGAARPARRGGRRPDYGRGEHGRGERGPARSGRYARREEHGGYRRSGRELDDRGYGREFGGSPRGGVNAWEWDRSGSGGYRSYGRGDERGRGSFRGEDERELRGVDYGREQHGGFSRFGQLGGRERDEELERRWGYERDERERGWRDEGPDVRHRRAGTPRARRA